MPEATSRSISTRAPRFSDGKPVTAEDVLFSWALLRDEAAPTTGNTMPR